MARNDATFYIKKSINVHILVSMFSYAFLMQVNSKNAEEAWRWVQEWKKIEAYLFNEIHVIYDY